jgi:hypothetical protein
MKYRLAILVVALACASGCQRAPSPASGTFSPASGGEGRVRGKPDLSGYWNLSRQQSMPGKEFLDSLPANTVFVNDTGAAELAIGDYGGLKPTPAALEAAKKWQPEDDMTISTACAPPSIIYSMQGPFPFEIHQGTEFIILRLEYFDLVRIVFMDGRPHPPAEAPHSKVGHSIGRWEGDTLVVDTTHLSAATLTNNGLGHSDNVHVIEKFTLSPDGKTLTATQEFEDPDALENRGIRHIVWNRVEGEYIYPYECDPSFGVNYGK